MAHPWSDLFFRFDPLAVASATAAARTWMPRLALALITVVLTLLAGRVWCGWVCPLGTLLEWVRIAPPGGRVALSPGWRAVKYFILALIIAAALFGNLTLMALDPISILTRTTTTVLLPSLNETITAVERALYPLRPFQPPIDWIERVLRGTVLTARRQYFAANVAGALLLGGILALNALSERFWCRYLCPLGGLLALLSKVAPFRRVVGDDCSSCGMCIGTCPMDTIDPLRGYESDPGECIVCLDCLVECPRSGIGFRWHWGPTWREYDPSRRQVLAALGLSAAGVALINTSAQAGNPDPHLIRPPGAVDEEFDDSDFLSRCIRCGACIKVCPTGGLQPSGLEVGLKGLWTPHLVPRLGQCDYGCHACGQVCPTGAIPSLTLEVKRSTVIGRAYIDTDRCLPWADDIPCAVCEEVCPVPGKAIVLLEGGGGQGRGRRGNQARTAPRPQVVSSRCIGCGLCEKLCPLNGEAAIRVYSPNEPPPPFGYGSQLG